MELSIITINRNYREGLRRTMESVVSQTFQGFEYIIVDGASTDDSTEEILRFEERIPRLKWVSEKDNGIFDAMNKGVRMSGGRYLLFLNSGDILDSPDVLQCVFGKRHEADIIIGRCRVIRDRKEIWITTPKEKYSFGDLFHASIAHQASFIDRSLFEKYGYYREDLRIMGDWEFFLRTIVLNNCTIEAFPSIIARYELDGVSSDSQSTGLIAKEKNHVFSIHHLGCFVPDYLEFDRRMASLEPAIWAQGKKWLYQPIVFLYQLAKRFSRMSHPAGN